MVSAILFLILTIIPKNLNFYTFSNLLLPISTLFLCNLPCFFVIQGYKIDYLFKRQNRPCKFKHLFMLNDRPRKIEVREFTSVIIC
jgi:hypothetical protein